MLKKTREFVTALAVVILVLAVLALPYALTEVQGLKVKKLILVTQMVVLVVFSAGILIWRLAGYRQTSNDIETRGEEIERTSHSSEKPRTPHMEVVDCL